MIGGQASAITQLCRVLSPVMSPITPSTSKLEQNFVSLYTTQQQHLSSESKGVPLTLR